MSVLHFSRFRGSPTFPKYKPRVFSSASILFSQSRVRSRNVYGLSAVSEVLTFHTFDKNNADRNRKPAFITSNDIEDKNNDGNDFANEPLLNLIDNNGDVGKGGSMSSPIERNQRPTFLPPFMSGEPETRSDSGNDDDDAEGNFVSGGGAGSGAEERRETREMEGAPWGDSDPDAATGPKRSQSEASSQPLATKENKGDLMIFVDCFFLGFLSLISVRIRLNIARMRFEDKG